MRPRLFDALINPRPQQLLLQRLSIRAVQDNDIVKRPYRIRWTYIIVLKGETLYQKAFAVKLVVGCVDDLVHPVEVAAVDVVQLRDLRRVKFEPFDDTLFRHLNDSRY